MFNKHLITDLSDNNLIINLVEQKQYYLQSKANNIEKL